MAGVSFSDREAGVWIVAGWAFRSLLSDVSARFRNDHEIAEALDEAETLGFLHVESLDKSLAERVASAISEVATGILTGAIRPQIAGRFDDATIEQYHNALRMLLRAIPELSIATPRAS